MDVLTDNFGTFLDGLVVTIELAVISVALALPFGIVLAASRVSPVPALRRGGAIYIEIVRNTPLPVVFFFAVFVLPQLGVGLSFFSLAVIALATYYGAFFCEAVRSGINAVSIGQAEAARSIGLTSGQTLRAVVLPQALRAALPPLINVAIALVKNTAIASAFGTAELLSAMQELTNRESSHVIAVLVTTAIIYLILTVPLGLAASAMERGGLRSR